MKPINFARPLLARVASLLYRTGNRLALLPFSLRFPMKDHYDPWYIRLPDGRVVKAKSTASVRHHVEAGHIPLNSMARRTPEDEWVSLAWIQEFADIVGGQPAPSSPDGDSESPSGSQGSVSDMNLKSGVSARLDPMRLQTVGVRGLVDELIAAFDSTVSNGKVLVAVLAGCVGGIILAAIPYLVGFITTEISWLPRLLSGVVGLFIFAVTGALLTRHTHLELSRMRPVTPAEARDGIAPFAIRAFLGYLLTIGVACAVLVLLQRLPEWSVKLTSGLSGTVAEILATAIGGVGLLIAMFAGFVLLLSLLMIPILIVEECSVGDAFREWRALFREHRVRILVYEGMALALAMISAIPLAIPVYLALSYGPGLPPNLVSMMIQGGVMGIAIGPVIAFLAVANLFIYLNVRYEAGPNR